MDRSSIDKLENYVLACGIRGSRWTDDQAWKMSPGLIPDEKDFGNQDEGLKEINQVRYDVTRPLLEFRKVTKGRKKASEICGALYDFLCATGVPAKIETFIDHFRNCGKLSLEIGRAHV